MSKLKVETLLACDYALTSNQGKLSLMGIFDRIFVTKLPSTYARFFIVAVLKSEPGAKHRIKLELVGPSGKSILPSQPVEIQFSAYGKANLMTDIGNLNLTEVGEYQAQLVDEKGQVVSSYPIAVTKAEANPNKGSN